MLAWLTLCALARPLLAASPQDPLIQAKKLFDKGRPAEAETLLAEILKREPADERVWALLGRVKIQTGERAGALEALRMALRLSPADTLTRMRLDMIADLAPEAAASHGRAEPAAKTPRPPSALERAAFEELGRAAADPEHVGCGATAPVVLDPLWTLVPDASQPPQPGPSFQPLQPDGDAALELSGLVAARLSASGVGVVLTRHGPYSVRLAERAALAEMSGGAYYLALAVTSESGQSDQSGKPPSPVSPIRVEALVLGPAAAKTPGAVSADAAFASNAARLAALAGPNDPVGQVAPIGPIGAFGQFGATGVMGGKPSAVERLHAQIRRAALEREGYALAARILARCRADGLAEPAQEKGAPVAGDVALLSAIDRPAVLLAVNIRPGPQQARREALEKLAASLAKCILEEGGRCP
jgi:hypothetical protein